jgi:hypothetical protein
MYPNLYVVMVAKPGSGKTRAIRLARDRLQKLPNMFVGASYGSREKMMSKMVEANKLYTAPNGTVISMCNFNLIFDELASFIKPKDFETMTVLTDLFDCPKVTLTATLGRGDNQIENLFLSLLGGITAKNIAEHLGRAAIGLGFTARVNFIYTDEVNTMQVFNADGSEKEPEAPHDFTSLDKKLLTIHKTWGRFHFQNDVGIFIQNWLDAGMPPRPTDARFEEYLTRRSLHFFKLCMIRAASKGGSLHITMQDALWAQETLLEAEAVMPASFRYMGASSAAEAIRGLLYFVHTKGSEGVSEADLRKKLLEEVLPYQLDSTIEQIVASGQLKVVGEVTKRYFPPTK